MSTTLTAPTLTPIVGAFAIVVFTPTDWTRTLALAYRLTTTGPMLAAIALIATADQAAR